MLFDSFKNRSRRQKYDSTNNTCIISTMCNDVKFGERVRRPRSIFQELEEGGSSRSWKAAAFANFPIHAPPI